jgi:phenylacetate-CoA ligase
MPESSMIEEELKTIGAMVIYTGNTDVASALSAMLGNHVTGYVGTATFLMDIINKAKVTNNYLPNNFVLERAWFTGEMLTTDVRDALEAVYGIDSRQAYTVSEMGGLVAYECAHKSGLHVSDDFVLEIVDKSGKQLKPGEVGEIVLTPVNNKAWGILRYGTGALASLTTAHCACGRTAPRLLGIQKAAII